MTTSASTAPSAPPALPAPSGAPLSTALRPPAPEVTVVPTLPRLPPVVPRAAAPATGQVAAITAATLLTVATTATVPPTEPSAPKRRHKVLIVLAIVIALMATTAVIFRNSALVGRFTGRGYDTNPMPLHAVPPLKFTGAQFTVTYQSVGVLDGLPTNLWFTNRWKVDYTSNSAKMTFQPAKATIIGGSIGKPQQTSPPRDVYLDQHASYRQGRTGADAWVRSENAAGQSLTDVLRPDLLPMFQDVVDPSLRALEPTSLAAETRHGIAVTTYTYSMKLSDFYESAPRMFNSFHVVDSNAADDANVILTMSFDKQWMVRYLDVNLDVNAVLEFRASKHTGTEYQYRYTVDVISISDTPESIVIPTNTITQPVDQPATTVTP